MEHVEKRIDGRIRGEWRERLIANRKKCRLADENSLKAQARHQLALGLKSLALDFELPMRYRRAVRNTPVNPKRALFIEGKLSTVPDAFALIMPMLESRYGMDVQFVALNKMGVDPIRYNSRCLELMDEMARAAYVFLEDASNVVSCVDLRPETKVIQLWHACGAFKKWGMSTADLQFGGTRAEVEKHPFYKNLSLVTVSSPEVEWAYREAMVLQDTPEVVQPLGVSRTDVFFDEEFLRDSARFVKDAAGIVGNRKMLLYAPTFRGHTKDAEGPDQLDIHAMKQSLGDTWALLVKHHPFVRKRPPIPDDCADFACDVSDVPIDKLLASADACITDYSSIVFEYSLLERPIAFFAYDIDEYNDWRGFYYDYDEMTPGPVARTTSEIIEYFAHVDDSFDRELVNEFRERFMSACDGHATERICETVLSRRAGR